MGELSMSEQHLESWLNGDPEMRFAEVSVGENLRWRVVLKQLSFDEPHEAVVAKAEAISLQMAIHLAVPVNLEATR